MSFEVFVHHVQFEGLCVSAAAADQISRGGCFARSINILQNPLATAGVVEVGLSFDASSCLAEFQKMPFHSLTGKKKKKGFLLDVPRKAFPGQLHPAELCLVHIIICFVMHIYCKCDGVRCL